MCGINGVFSFGSKGGRPSRQEVLATRDHMALRGPDGSGEWWNEERSLGLGHRRLSILDLSERSNQPMSSPCGRYVVVYNGEIYNYPSLRRDLESKGAIFRTTSDTEALLHLYALKGVEMVRELRGMFAFAIWDNAAQQLFLARDPYGIKPLYTSSDGNNFRFASQVKALLAGGSVSKSTDPAGLVGFLLWGSVPDPFTLYDAIRSLPAGSWQIVDKNGPQAPIQYASIASAFAAGSANPAPDAELEARLREATLESVSAHLLADVEVGVFLSAGVDSGAVLGLMRDAGQKQVKAITLAFQEFVGTQADEAPIATQVARHYGADHIVRTVSKAEYEADLPRILSAMDQPSIDGINVWFVSKAAREAGLKVALSGLGGDELLAGYPSFHQIPRLVSLAKGPSAVPGVSALSRALFGLFGIGTRNPKALGLIEYGGTYPGAYLLRRGLFMPYELKSLLDAEYVDAALERLQPLSALNKSMTPEASHPISRIAALESANFMRMQLLRDADWAGMAHSLEIRTPLVDFNLLRSVADLVPRMKQGVGKQLMARVPQRPLPPCVLNRPKSGFGVPVGRWVTRNSIGSAEQTGHVSRLWAKKVLSQMAGPILAET